MFFFLWMRLCFFGREGEARRTKLGGRFGAQPYVFFGSVVQVLGIQGLGLEAPLFSISSWNVSKKKHEVIFGR